MIITRVMLLYVLLVHFKSSLECENVTTMSRLPISPSLPLPFLSLGYSRDPLRADISNLVLRNWHDLKTREQQWFEWRQWGFEITCLSYSDLCKALFKLHRCVSKVILMLSSQRIISSEEHLVMLFEENMFSGICVKINLVMFCLQLYYYSYINSVKNLVN